jgi:HSP20 family molecular chaperone IbpA
MFNENLVTKKEEPLIDVFDETHAVKIYVEVLADIKNEMRLKVTKSQIEIAAGDFCKFIDLSAYNIEPEKTYYRCNSHVLEIVLPKKEKVEILVAV